MTDSPERPPIPSVLTTQIQEIQRYYGTSDNELGRRYIKDEAFVSKAYCEAALRHRYELYPFIHELVDFDSWHDKRVLDVGCGHGADLFQFARAGAHAFGCDVTLKHCVVSRDFVHRLDSSAQLTQGSATQLPFGSGTFDLVYSFGVLLLIENLAEAIAEIRRILKPGGTVIVMFYNRLSLHYYLKTLLYYGVVCDLEDLLGPRRLVDWFTDGFGYPRTYHHTADSLRHAFRDFRIEKVVVRNLTAEQTPLIQRERFPREFWEWLASRLGFYLILRGTA